MKLLGPVKRISQGIQSSMENVIVKDVCTELASVTSVIGNFGFQWIKDKLARQITFTVGGQAGYYNDWMEEALYAILYTYNDIKKQPNLQLVTYDGGSSTAVYYRLNDGSHRFKYRDYDIMLFISTQANSGLNGRVAHMRTYTIVTFNLGKKFVTQFEADMIRHRNNLLRFKTDAGTITTYRDCHESDGYTYWDKGNPIQNRSFDTIYLDKATKLTIINTINRFFSERAYYEKHGIPHNLTIVLHGPPAVGKESLAKAIASAWHRNIYYVTGGKNGRFIPDAITSSNPNVNNPLFVISDIDRYPFLINDELPAEGSIDQSHIEENKLSFVHMINALDGIMSGDGRIIIMTTNHIEKFSPTFLRPGRVDLCLELKRVTPEVFRKFTYDFYDGEVLPKGIKLKRDDIAVSELHADVVFRRISLKEFLHKYVKGY